MHAEFCRSSGRRRSPDASGVMETLLGVMKVLIPNRQYRSPFLMSVTYQRASWVYAIVVLTLGAFIAVQNVSMRCSFRIGDIVQFNNIGIRLGPHVAIVAEVKQKL